MRVLTLPTLQRFIMPTCGALFLVRAILLSQHGFNLCFRVFIYFGLLTTLSLLPLLCSVEYV